MQDDDRALFRCQQAERPVDGISIDDGHRDVRAGRWRVGQDLHRDYQRHRFAFDVAGVDHDPVQPGVETSPVAKCREVAPGVEERLLSSVLSAVWITDDAVRERIAAIHVLTRQNGERLLVALCRPLDELVLHGAGHLACAAAWPHH